MKKNRKPHEFLNDPFYKGGAKALDAFITSRLTYPEEAKVKKIEGDVEVKYDINHKGRVIKTTVLKGIGHGCDEEACRLVELLHFEVHVPRGIKAIFHRTIKIHFRLPKMQMSYTYQSKKKTDHIPEKASTYSYSIKLPKKT